MSQPTQTDDWLRKTRITARAAEGIEELPASERSATLELLAGPFFHHHPHKMALRKDVALWRVRVNRDVRVTYTLREGNPLILHVGRHRASDRFVTHCTEPDDAGIPLEVYVPMKAELTAPSRMTVNGSPHSETPPLAEDLMRVLGALVKETVHREDEAGSELALEATVRLDEALKALREQVAEIAQNREEIVERVEIIREEPGVPVDEVIRLRAEQHELHQHLVECQGRAEEQARRLGFARSDLQAQLNEMRETVEILTGEVALLRTLEEERQNTWLKRLWRRWFRS